MPRWEIEKEPGGATFVLYVGAPGVPGCHKVPGLSRAQGEALGSALIALCDRQKAETQVEIQSALGIK